MIIKYFIIANPRAGSGKINELLPLVESSFSKNNIKYEIHYTKSRGDAGSLAKKAISLEFTHIISVGGDGTTSEIAGQIVNKEIRLGVIPIGSGNDFPKAMGIPLTAKESINTIVTGKIVKCDAAFLGSRCFINGLGIGMDGAVAHMFSLLKKYFGQSGYIVGAVFQAFKFAAFQTKLYVNECSIDKKLLLFGASNGPFQGGKFNLAPDASIFDGLLDFHVISDMNPFERLLKIPKVLKGEKNLRKVDLIKSKQLEFETFVDLPAHIDGEVFTLVRGKHKIEISENSINLIVPSI